MLIDNILVAVAIILSSIEVLTSSLLYHDAEGLSKDRIRPWKRQISLSVF